MGHPLPHKKPNHRDGNQASGPRVLSVRQPWAIVSGVKPVENRSWSTRYRGQVLIHASTTVDARGLGWFKREGIALPTDLILGAIIGSCELIDMVHGEQGLRFGNWFSGPIGWVVNNAREYVQPVYVKGSLGLCRPSAAIIRRAMSSASCTRITTEPSS
jgi:hypothetical protein